MKKLLFLIIFLANYVYSGEVNILTWWDYIPQNVIETLRKKHKINISVYKTNEEALAKILSKRKIFDLIIISNSVIQTLINQKVFLNKKILKHINKSEYIKSLIDIGEKSCIPYLWSESVFFSNNTKQIDELKNTPITPVQKIILIDDMLEIFTRVVIDNSNCKINKGIFKSLSNCEHHNIPNLENIFKTAKFKTDIIELNDKKILGYAWSGEVLKNTNRVKNLRIVYPKHKPIISSDYICTTNTRINNQTIEVLKQLTNKKNIENFAKETSYYSPIIKHVKKSRVKKLFRDLERNDFVYIDKANDETMKRINLWWKLVRYAN